MTRLGGMEWVIILLIVVLVFGPGRIGKVAEEISKGIKSFRDGLGRDDNKAEQPESKTENK